ncbi:MAG: ATP-binding protein [Candidatus Hermodarchaeia archaeon]
MALLVDFQRGMIVFNLTRYRVFGKVGLNLIFVVSFAIVGFYLLFPDFLTFSTNITNIALHALFGIIAMLTGAMAVFRSRREHRVSSVLLSAAFLFLGILHLMGALFQMYNLALPGSYRPPHLLFVDLLEFTIFISLISIAMLIRLFWDREVDPDKSWFYGLGIIGGLLGLFGGIYLIAHQLPHSIICFLTMYLSGLLIGFIGLAVYFVFKSPELRNQFDQLWILTALLLYALTLPFNLTSIFLPVQVWVPSIICVGFALISFNLAVSIPELRHIGMEKQHAFFYAFILSAFAFLPFLTAFLFENLTATGFINYQLYITIRLGAVIISLGIAILLLIYSRQKKTRTLLPLMLAFVFWALIEAVLLIFGPYDAVYHESKVPYIIGYIAVFILLGISLYWKQRPPKQKMEQIPWGRIIGSVTGLLIALGISVILENILELVNPVIQANPFDSTFLLILSFVNIFLFAALGYLYMRDARGQITIGLLALSFLMLWIIPGILKANFPMWDMGWWAAEVLLLGGLLIAPIVFGIAYLRTLQETEDSEKRAKLYSDILAHDISNYHQAMLTSLELLELPELPSEMEEEVKMEIHLSLRRADHLIKNVRQLGKIEQMPKSVHEPMDLVATINLAADQVFKALRAEDIIFHMNEPEGKCFIDANPLLIDLFQNLIRNAVEYSDGQNRVDIEIDSDVNNGREYYRIRIIDYGRGIPPERKDQLFNRYMDGAFGSGIGLSVVRALSEAFEGWVEVEDRVAGDFEKGTVFIVTLPKSSNST